MAELDFLDEIHPQYTMWAPHWRMNERRGIGDVAEDLLRFVGESDEAYRRRQDRFTYTNFMWAHAHQVTGHTRMYGAPGPSDQNRFSMGQMGVIREAEQVTGDGDLAERVFYNVDRPEGDGIPMPLFMDGVDERAQYTGHRTLMVETPPTGGAEIGLAQARAGLRPYLAEFSPLEETMWAFRNGVPEFRILRVPVEVGRVVDGAWKWAAEEATKDGDPFPGRGYYLLVRAGCRLLGPKFEEGGYWLFNHRKEPIRHRLWGPRLRGRIPVWYHFGEQSPGTVTRPSISRSPTEGLGRIGVSLMDCLSARDWDAFDAARSGKWFSPADPAMMEKVKEQWEGGSYHTGVPPFVAEDGTMVAVTVTDDSSGAVAPEVFQAIIDAKFVEAAQQSFQVLTSEPGSSGISKIIGHKEHKAPYLTRRATYREASDGSAIWFMEARSGYEPRGYSRWTKVFTLAEVVDDISRVLQEFRLNSFRSEDLETELAVRMVKDRLGGLPLPDGVSEDTIRQQIRQSIEEARTSEAQAGQLAGQFGGGA